MNFNASESQSSSLLLCTPLFSLRRWSISAWSFCRVSLCCSCRNWMLLSSDVTRRSAWPVSSGAALIPASVNGITGRGLKCCWLTETRGNGNWRSGGKLVLDIPKASGTYSFFFSFFNLKLAVLKNSHYVNQP